MQWYEQILFVKIPFFALSIRGFVNENIGVRLISDIYRLFFLFGFTQGLRSFCADRKARLSERNASLLANCRAWVLYPKNQRALRMGAFLTAAEADDFWGCGTRSLRSLKQSSPLSKSHWRRLPKSLMRINEPINEKKEACTDLNL